MCQTSFLKKKNKFKLKVLPKITIKWTLRKVKIKKNNNIITVWVKTTQHNLQKMKVKPVFSLSPTKYHWLAQIWWTLFSGVLKWLLNWFLKVWWLCLNYTLNRNYSAFQCNHYIKFSSIIEIEDISIALISGKPIPTKATKKKKWKKRAKASFIIERSFKSWSYGMILGVVKCIWYVSLK